MVCDAPYLQNEFCDPRFFYVFNIILSFSKSSQSFKKICTWELWARTSLSNYIANVNNRRKRTNLHLFTHDILKLDEELSILNKELIIEF